MASIKILSEESIAALKRDHDRLRYQVDHLHTQLRFFRSESGGGQSGNAVAVTTQIIPGRDGDTPGGPIKVQRKKIDNAVPVLFIDDGPEVDCWSWVKSDSSDPADEDDDELWIFIERDAHGVWWFTGQDCPTGS